METEVLIPGVFFCSISRKTIPVPGIKDKVPESDDRSAGTSIVSILLCSIIELLTNLCLLLHPANITNATRQKKIGVSYAKIVVVVSVDLLLWISKSVYPLP